jgi:hypothetical protein
METVIFYDDKKSSCRQYAEELMKYEDVICKKASEYQNKTVIFELDNHVGFLFESENGKIPKAITHVICSTVMGKKETPILIVTGGGREIKAIKSAKDTLNTRGYSIKNIYTKYVFDKYDYNVIAAVRQIMSDVENQKENLLFKDKTRGLSSKQLKKHIRMEVKAYKSYRKKIRRKEKGD